jgi:hypothetical protein
MRLSSSSLLQPLQLLCNLLSLVWYAMCLLRLRPEVRHRELAVEICAEVVHDADREENVHAELLAVLVAKRSGDEDERTLATSRLGPPMLARVLEAERRGCGVAQGSGLMRSKIFVEIVRAKAGDRHISISAFSRAALPLRLAMGASPDPCLHLLYSVQDGSACFDSLISSTRKTTKGRCQGLLLQQRSVRFPVGRSAWTLSEHQAYRKRHPTSRFIYYKRKDRSCLIAILSGRSRVTLGVTKDMCSAVHIRGKRQV